MSNKKYGSFIGVLYPDDPRTGDALDILNSSDGQFFYCIHNCDLKDDLSGELKKEHIHFVFKPVNPRTLKGFADSIGIPSNYIEPCKSVRASVRYLIHLDDPDKFQYPSDCIRVGGTSTYSDVIEFLQDAPRKLSDDEMASAIVSYILDQKGGVSVSRATVWALENGYYSAFRRGFSIFSQLIREVNNNETESHRRPC